MAGHRFITGANGRIGQVLVARLVSQGETVVGLARSEAKAEEVRSLGATCIVGSMADADALAQGLDGAEQVYHLAGGFRGPGTETPARINEEGTAHLAQALSAHPPKVVVFTSSCAVYGDRSGLWVDETMPPHPHTRYGESKVAAEQTLQAAASTAGFSLRIVRLAATYGHGFPWLMDDRIQQGKGWLPGEGRNFVPTIHVDDAVTGLTLIANKGASGIYNLADTEPVPLQAFYDAVHQCVGGQRMRFWSTWVPSYVQFFAARNMERAQSRLGSTPRFTPDALKLFTASVRMNVDRVREELGMEWAHPEPTTGVHAVLNDGRTDAT